MGISSVLIEIILLILLILINGFLALAEIALISVRKVRLQTRVDEGDRNADFVLKLTEYPSDFLSAVQIGITLIGIVAGAVSGATIGRHLGALLGNVPFLAPYSDLLGVTIVVILVSYLTLLLGELVPKRLALTDPEKYAMLVARPMWFFSKLNSPVVRFLSHSTELVLKLLRNQPSSEPLVTEEEIKLMIDQGTSAGIIQSAEREMLGEVFRLADQSVENLLTPRTEVVWLDLDDSLDVNLAKVIQSPHSRFPVARDNLDNVIGVVQTKRMIVMSLRGEAIDLHGLLEDPILVPESMPALKVLDLFSQSGQRMAFVMDEFGGFQGLVTVNDILGAIGGDVLVKDTVNIPEITQRADGSWLVDGMLAVDDLKEFLDIDVLPDEQSIGYQTVGGLVMAILGAIPKPSDSFNWKEYQFEVIDMDGLRVDKILISRLVE